ncbi:fatty acid desaturase [Mesorhizobium sp. GbtcB19]|uniref:fatty acid desaturase family protein n=1 Tax=Mesorhizobium sp. GbtcB19 TaxID=2824764 RepID=UPI001C303118|nr:fatty acid desaturase [Mesorhizobium sp. GbtcB19]
MTDQDAGTEALLRELSAVSHDDYSNSFAKLRGRLTDSRGIRLPDFVRDLQPAYRRVYFDIAVGYAALAAVVALVSIGQWAGIWPVALGLLGAILIGYWALYLTSFIHEGAHWNLAPDRTINDWLSNLLLSWIIALEIGFYRKVHFEHHRSLGTIHDTEISYFSPLNARFLVRSLLGIRAIETLLSYHRNAAAGHKPMARASAGTGGTGTKPFLLFAIAITVHGSIVLALSWSGLWPAAIAWVLGFGAVLPFFGSIRQLLEHRTEDARPDQDYTAIDQGACARIFGPGYFASTFGSAGFNRHLLHHWEPQVSYTRLADLERFLADTPMRVVMDRRRVSYAETFRRHFSLY